MARLRVVPRLSLLTLICFSSLFAPSAGWSRSPQKILVLDPQSVFVSPEQLSKLGTLLRQFAKTHPNLRPARKTDLAELRKKAKCLGTDNRCLKALGKAALSKKVLFSQIQKLPGRYMFVMSLLDTRSGKQVKRARTKTENLLPALRLAAKNAFDSIFGQALPIRLAINANTTQARVYLDGKSIGQTPLKVKQNLVAGKHKIRVIHPDYQESVRAIHIKPSQTKLRLNFNLKKRTPKVAQLTKMPAPAGPTSPTKTTKPKTTSIPIIVKIDPAKKQTEQKASSPAKKTVAQEKPGSQPSPSPKVKPEKQTPVAKAKTCQPNKIDKSNTSIAEKKPSKLEQDRQTTKKPSPPGFATPAAQEVKPSAFTWSYLSKKWWFWTAIGSAVLVGVVTGTVVGLASDDSSYPSGSGRIVIGF